MRLHPQYPFSIYRSTLRVKTCLEKVKRCFSILILSFVLDQALEEAATNAAEEEQRRLQTQTELQDRYQTDLEREQMVRHPPPSHRNRWWSKSRPKYSFLFLVY